MSKADVRRRSRVATPVRSRSHHHLGRSLRTILFAPKEGFAGIAGRSIGGRASYFFTFFGGAALALLWLKIGALIGVREFCEPRYLGGYVAAAAAMGGLLALPVASLWSLGGSSLGPVLHGEKPSTGTMRFVWGAAAFPSIVAMAVLLPLDLLVVGPETFTTEELREPLSTAWAAFSLALGVSALGWGLWILLRGYAAATEVPTRRALVGVALALAVVAVVIGAVVAVSIAVSGGGTCPTPQP